jgi:uncharacterized protein
MKAFLSPGVLFILFSSFSVQAQAIPAKAQSDAPASTQSKAVAPSHIDPQKEANIRRLVEISGVKNNFAASISTMSTMMRSSLEKSGMSNEKARAFSDLFFEKMQAKMVGRFDDLLEMLIPIYDKYYTNEDLEGLIAFYSTPLGRKLLKNSPDVLRDSQTAGYQWGSKIGEESEREVLAEHPELKAPPPVFTNQ